MNKKGFSLVELMIVIVVIGVLIALIFPSITKARDGALQRQCANNLSQISAALVLYANDHCGAFPDPVGDNEGNEDATWWVYKNYLIDQDGTHPERAYLPNNDKLFDCPGSPHIGTVADPDYWYGNSAKEYDEEGNETGDNDDYPFTFNSRGWRLICGCNNLGAPDYDGPHSKGSNYVTIPGRVYWEADN